VLVLAVLAALVVLVAALRWWRRALVASMRCAPVLVVVVVASNAGGGLPAFCRWGHGVLALASVQRSLAQQNDKSSSQAKTTNVTVKRQIHC
jgi:hypothetical protein